MAESLREADIISRKSVAQKVVPPCHGESATGFEPMAGIAIPHVGSSSLTPPPRNLHSLVTMQKMGKLQPARIEYYRVCLLEAFISGSSNARVGTSSRKHTISFWGSFITLQYQPAPYIKTRWGPPEHMSLDHHPREVIKT